MPTGSTLFVNPAVCSYTLVPLTDLVTDPSRKAALQAAIVVYTNLQGSLEAPP